MILATYGHRLVRLYNERHQTEYTARSFFDEVFFPVVYDYAEFLQPPASNSPFFVARKLAYPKSSKAKPKPLTPEVRREALRTLHHKVKTRPPDASTSMGFPAADADSVTSGQVSNLSVPSAPDDAFASWIGAALALTVSGGFSLLVEADEVIWTTFEGWMAYRDLLEKPPFDNLKGQQINAWNAWYLQHCFSEEALPGTLPELRYVAPKKDQPNYQIEMLGWPPLILTLARRYPAEMLTAYVFNLGSTNTTIGFLPMKLPEVALLRAVYHQFFENEAALPLPSLERLYEADDTFRHVCERGALGLQAMQPKGLSEQMPDPKNPSLPAKLDVATITRHKLWILAMLGDQRQDLEKLAQEAARLFLRFDQGEKGRERTNLIDNLLNQRQKEAFLRHMTDVLEREPGLYDELQKLFRMAYEMPSDQLRLFLTLLKFHYVGLSKKPSQTELDLS